MHFRQTEIQIDRQIYLYSHWSPPYQGPAGSPESKRTIAHTDSLRLQTLCSVNSFSAVYQGAQLKPFEECFRAKKKKTYQGTSNNTEGTAAVDLALSRLQSCVNVYKSTLQIQRDTSVTGVGPPWPYRPPHKH